MAKRPSKHLRAARPLRSAGCTQQVSKNSIRYYIRQMPGARALKNYTCPGCQHIIKVGIPHLVVWPIDATLASPAGLEYRRHWHFSCWQAS